MAKKKKRIDFEEERYGMYMSDNSYDLDVMYGRNYLKTDSPFFINYYKVNTIKSVIDDLYRETRPEDKKFFAPVKVNVMFDIDDGETKKLADRGIFRSDTGNMIFGVFEEELTEKGVEVIMGDYVSIVVSDVERFFEISDPNYVSDASSQSRGGFRNGYWRQVMAVPVKEDVVPVIMN